MPQFPGAMLPWIDRQICDQNGDPLAGGTVTFYAAGTTTPQNVYTDADLFVPWSNPLTLDDDGRPAGAVFLLPQAYRFLVKDADGALVYDVDDVLDIGQYFAENFGVIASQGGHEQVSGYEVQSDDRLVTMLSTGGPNPCLVNLLPSVDASQQLVIKNIGTIPLSVVPSGADTIEGLAAAFTVAAAASPSFPSITLIPDGVSGWYIVASHGL